jgi:hypothetical protein
MTIKNSIKNIRLKILAEFEAMSNQVSDLTDFDTLLLDLIRSSLEKKNKKLERYFISVVKKEQQGINSHDGLPINISKAFLLDREIMLIDTISENHSLKNLYIKFYNQCLVQLVSYFSHILSATFEHLVSLFLEKNLPFANGTEKLQFTIKEIQSIKETQENPTYKDFVKAVLTHKNINFQNTKSIASSFGDYFGITFDENNETSKDLCFVFESRNVIVHQGAVIDKQFFRRISPYGNSDLKDKVITNSEDSKQIIAYNKETIGHAKEAMQLYLEDIFSETSETYVGYKSETGQKT